MQPQVIGHVLQEYAPHDQIKSSMVVDQTPDLNQETIAQKLSRQEAEHHAMSDQQQLEAGYQKLESALSSKQLSVSEF